MAKKPGKLIIFNMNNFQNDTNGNLSFSREVSALQNTFMNFNADVDEVHTNLSLTQIMLEIQKISNADLNYLKYLVVGILTNGTRQNMIASRDNKYFNLDVDLILPILQNRSLKDKPKLFVIEACKGHFDLLTAQVDARKYCDPKEFVMPIPGNTLRCYATTEGFKAYGTNTDGLHFTIEFCKLLNRHGKFKSVEEIMKLTIKAVMEKTRNSQVPSYESNMTEPFILGKY